VVARYFSRNGEILPTSQAVVSLDDVAYSYGYGVYETIRVSGGVPYFADEHCARLLASAETISLEHRFSADLILQSINELIVRNSLEASNLKILLIGGKTGSDATLYIQSLNPLFPNPKLYKTGVHCITEQYERPFPHAKTLNMLPSYLAYKKAVAASAYDALLVNRVGAITEGSRTNFFCLKGTTIFSPPDEDILLGVMRMAMLQVAATQGFTIVRKPILLTEIASYDAAFLTSTSSKIMPIRSIDDHTFGEIPATLTDFMQHFNQFLADYGGRLAVLETWDHAFGVSK
jgi:branched-chain amino acid aminotransferase